MSDANQQVGYRPLAGGSSSTGFNDREITARLNVLKRVSPYMAQNPDALMQMAMSPLDNDTLFSTGAQHYAMRVGDNFGKQLSGMTPETQRTIFAQLSPGQQGALAQMGYKIPTRDDGSWLDLPVSIGAAILGPISRGAGAIPGVKPAVGGLLEGLGWVANIPGDIYRSVRSMDDVAQVAGAIGAVAGLAAALTLAPVTGGGSLAAYGALIGGGLLGAAGGSLAGSVVTGNVNDWWRAFPANWDGERAFDRPSQERARKLLADPRVNGLAQDLAAADLNIVDFAQEMAGIADPSEPSQIAKIEKLAREMATQGTPEYDKAVNSMINALSDDTFLRAVDSLVAGKMSPGRDFADLLSLDRNSGIYDVVSGTVDAVFTFAADPTLMYGTASKMYKVQRYGIRLVEGGTAASAALRALEAPGAMRVQEALADAVRIGGQGGLARVRSLAPGYEAIYGDLVAQSQTLKVPWTVGHQLEYFTGQTALEPILRGVGSRVINNTVVVDNASKAKMMLRELRHDMRSFTSGLSDVRVEAQTASRIEEMGTELIDALPAGTKDYITTGGLIESPWRYNQYSPKAYEAGRHLAGGDGGLARQLLRPVARVGDFLTSVSTMALEGSAIHLVGPRAVKDIRALSEMGRYMGMPSWARQAWADAVIAADSTAAKAQMVHGYIAQMLRLTGVEKTDEGLDLIDAYLTHAKKIYAFDDEIVVNGYRFHAGSSLRDQADMIRIPNIAELRKASTTQHLGKLAGITETRSLDWAINKVWKPAVLLRIGFIPRAAGEELAAWWLRGGIGSLMQEAGSRYVARYHTYLGAVEKRALQEAGTPIDLSLSEAAILNKGLIGTLPAHVRPLYRLMARTGFEDPATVKFTEYRDWLLKHVTLGARPGDSESVAALRALGKSGMGGNPGLQNFDVALGRWAGTPMAASREATLQLTRATRMRLNVADYGSSIVLGNPLSLRRMMAGGVDDTLLDASREWFSLHSTTVMRDATAGSHGPVKNENNASREMAYREVPDGRGGTRKEMQQVIRGEKRAVGKGQEGYDNGVHDQPLAFLEDPTIADAARRITSRVRTPNVTEAELGPIVDRAMLMGGVPVNAGDVVEGRVATQAREIVSELMEDFNPRTWRAMVRDLKVRGHVDLARVLDTQLPRLRDLTLLDVENALIRGGAEVTMDGELAGVLHALQRDGHEIIQYVKGLPTRADQAFAAQFIEGQMVAGQNSWWAERLRNRAAGLPDPPKWLYDNLEESFNDTVAHVYSARLDPNNHDEGVTKAMRAMQLDEEGQFVDSALKNETVLLYAAGRLPPRTTLEMVMQHSSNPALIRENQETIAYLLSVPAGEVGMVANQRLAAEMERVRRSMAGLDPAAAVAPRVLRQPRAIMDGRAHGALRPSVGSKRDGATQLWYYPTNSATRDTLPSPDAALDPILEWASHSTRSFFDTIRRSRRDVQRARGRVLEMPDGTRSEVPLLQLRDELGNTTPLMPGDAITPADANQLEDWKGRRVHYGSGTHMDRRPEDVTGGEEVMWELTGNMLRDNHREAAGAMRWQPRPKRINPRTGHAEVSSDVEPVLRSTVADVKMIPGDDLPTHALTEAMTYRHVGKWEAFVNFGFDKVIGPSIDAIVRKPMAFHAFAERYAQGRKMTQFLIDPELTAKAEKLAYAFASSRNGVTIDAEELAKASRAIAKYQGDTNATNWTSAQAMSFLRGHDRAELDDLLLNTMKSAKGATDPDAKLAEVFAARLARFDSDRLVEALYTGMDAPTLLATVRTKMPAHVLDHPERIGRTKTQIKLINGDPLLRWIHLNDGWGTITALHANDAFINAHVAESAAIAAISDITPFLDSHEFKTQFADYGKGFMPFWYAEENFLKRWGRGIAQEGLGVIRKAQLTYMGMRNAGVIRTDSQGKDWFVYPGSGLLANAVERMIPGLGQFADINVMFQTPTDQILPGMNNRFGTPSFNPLVSLPLEIVTSRVPELQPLERAMLGDYASQQGIIEQMFPAQLRHLFNNVLGNDDASGRYASAQMSAIAYLEAHGQGLEADATPGEVNEYMDRVREHARIIVVTQAIAGFILPGAPSIVEAGDSNATGIGLTDWADVLSTEYLGLIRMMGIEEGTAKFLELNKDATVHDIVNPLAYTVPKNVSASGAPIPSTEEAFQYYTANEDYFQALPDAAPWLLPQATGGGRSSYAYDSQVANGLRIRRTPEEYYRAMKFKEASGEYFSVRDEGLRQIAALQDEGNLDAARAVRATMDRDLAMYRTAHPIFAEEMSKSDGKQRRARTIEQMRTIVNDPQSPEALQKPALKAAMDLFDSYTSQLTMLGTDRSLAARARTDDLKARYLTVMDELTHANPGIMSFWVSVLKPESSLD